jgi:shikimate dehydrogenase
MTISASTRLYGVLGNPVSHSLSPILQNGWMKDYEIDGVFVALAIAESRFETALAGLFAAGLQGASVTIPFKERAAAWVGSSSAQAKAIGSVNCLRLDQEGVMGETTDGDGLIADMDARKAHWRAGTGRSVVLGAGGAARSILQALHDAGRDDIHVVNRTFERAEETARYLGQSTIHAYPWSSLARSLEGASLIINATSAGLGGLNPLIIDLSKTDSNALVYDCVYAPRETAFLTSAKDQGRQTCDGLGMLAGQGAIAFEHWFGIRPDLLSGIKRFEAALAA